MTMKRFLTAKCVIVLCLFANSLVCAQPAPPSNIITKEGIMELYSDVQNKEIRVSDAEQILLSYKDKVIAAAPYARIASLQWENNDILARQKISGILAFTYRHEDDDRTTVIKKTTACREIVKIVVAYDPDWSSEIADACDKSAAGRSLSSLNAARDLIENDPEKAAEMAENAASDETIAGMALFLRELRLQNPDQANRAFLDTITRYANQSSADARQFSILGTYLFTSPHLPPDDIISMVSVRIGNMGMPDLSSNRPDIQPDLVMQFIRQGLRLMRGPAHNDQQKQYRYALAFQLIPKGQEFAPALVPELNAAMAALATDLPGDFGSGEAFKNYNRGFSDPDARLEEIAEISDTHTRDLLYLDMASAYWRRKDYDVFERAAKRIENREANALLVELAKFGKARSILESKGSDYLEALRLINTMKVSKEKLLILLMAGKGRMEVDPVESSNLLNEAMSVAQKLDDGIAPFALLHGATLLPEDPGLLNIAIDTFKRFPDANSPDLNRRIELGVLKATFQLNVKDVDLSFRHSFEKVISGKADLGFQLLAHMKDDRIKADGYVAVARDLVREIDKTRSWLIKREEALSQVEVISVGEDGMRKSAKTSVLPAYPDTSVKNKKSGVAVAELQYDGEGKVTNVKVLEAPDKDIDKAVETALRKWTFKPSTINGRPISVKGKLTFYFEQTDDNKGIVKNPKQFQ